MNTGPMGREAHPLEALASLFQNVVAPQPPHPMGLADGFGLVHSRDLPRGGRQSLYRFKNGYGASVVRHAGSYGGAEGLWELAVVVWRDEKDADSWDLCYETSVTSDVLGWLTDAARDEALKAVEALPARSVRP